MNSKQIVAAMNNISSDYILSAQMKLGYYSDDRPDKTLQLRNKSIRRTLALAAAVVLLISVCFTTALAVNPEFREFVFAFFKVTEPEVVPDMVPDEGGTGSMEVEDGIINIGGVIEGTYIHFPAMSSARNGVFTVCTDEVQMNSGSHYDAYYEKDGEFIRLDEHTFSQVYHLFGKDTTVAFEWAEYKGEVIITYVGTEDTFVKFSGSGDAASTLMLLAIDPPGDTEFGYYPVLINVRTGELTDVCAGLGVEKLSQIRQAAISDDLTQMLIVDWDGSLYYADLAGRKLYALDALLGARASACTLVGDELAVWSEMYGACTVRVFNTDTWESRETYSGNPEFIRGFDSSIHSGNMYRGTCFALEVNANMEVSVVDLFTGERSLIDGFKWQQSDSVFTECVPSADGRKLLIYSRGQERYYRSIGVLDFASSTYLEFSRENAGSVNEHTAYWFDDDSVAIATSGDDSTRQYYIYRLLEQ